MLTKDIQAGKKYIGKVNGRLVPVYVDEIRNCTFTGRKRFYVTNTMTGRRTVFRSAQKFRMEVTSE